MKYLKMCESSLKKSILIDYDNEKKSIEILKNKVLKGIEEYFKNNRNKIIDKYKFDINISSIEDVELFEPRSSVLKYETIYFSTDEYCPDFYFEQEDFKDLLFYLENEKLYNDSKKYNM